MTRARDIASGIDYITGIDAGEVLPHIIPGTLYPAVSGNDLNGTDIDTSHGSTYTYGTTHADGRMYYYTDIKGSKPIKDPRIGAHFGSQRHMFTSIQLLEQETATHGKNVYSVDGREWIRVVDGTGTWLAQNNAEGAWLYQNGSDCTGMVIEITGYFNDINTLNYTYTNNPNDIDIKVNGTMSHEGCTNCAGNTSAETPLGARYVRSASLSNFGSTVSTSLGTSPAINTIHIECTNGSSEYWRNFGIELIAQDTTSTTTKSQIQIPSQNVVSYGKKLTVSGTPHYDPFNGFTNSSDLHSAYVDTATSLGLDSAPGSSASWAISSTNNIRPYNGMRVVKWVDSSGTIKTSVTAMPPNAQNIKTTASNEITTPSATNTTTTPNMSDDAIDHSLSEVAKTYHWREFGNGAANTGGYDDYKADATMLKDVVDDIGYVMDDGLTSLVGNDVRAASHLDLRPEDDAGDDFWASTFIGTGVSITTKNYAAGIYHIACNLPYGTHALKVERDANATPDMSLDGLSYTDVSGDTYGCLWEITFYQPKMPPIPEDAVVIADYMLMADFVRQADPNAANAPWEHHHTVISKGVRMCGPSRDLFYEETTGGHVFSFDIQNTGPGGFYCASNSTSSGGQNNYVQLPAFGTTFLLNNNQGGGIDLYVNGTDVAHTTTTGHNFMDISYPDSATTLGLNIFKGQGLASDYSPYIGPKGFMVVSPIHTSSHYQPFETPYLHELVGGDRNMEQTNLVVTPDGKTWDQVTRDTSYIGNIVVSCSTDTAYDSDTSVVVFDEWRGAQNGINYYYNKDFAIAYDRMICLVPGCYEISARTIRKSSGTHCQIQINGTGLMYAHGQTDAHDTPQSHLTVQLVRGDTIKIVGKWYQSLVWSNFHIKRV